VKHLPKHERPRWRYLAVGLESWPDADIDRGGFQRAVWYAASNLLGDPGSADAVLELLTFRFAAGAGEAVLRVRRGEAGPARAALACVSEVGGDPVGLRVRGVSGTIRACEERYLGRRDGASGQRSVAFGNADRVAHERDGGLDVRGPSGFTAATELDLDSE